MKHPELKAEARTTLGKQVKKLRREGILPANVYGKALSSVAVQVKSSEFETIFKEVGETGLIDLVLNSEKRPVLVKNIQWNFRNNMPLHADFYQVNLKEKVKSMVPLVVIGEPKAVADKLGMLLTSKSEVEVEALPESLPEHIEVDVTPLAALGDQITVGDLKAPEGVTILDEAEQVVAQIGELVVEEKEPETTEAAMPEVIGEKEKEAAAAEAASEEAPQADEK